jgi:hypothetical protein
VDSLAVLRAIALQQANDTESQRVAEDLKTTLEERFSEAQWRGTSLHKRTLARFQLDIAGEPEPALRNAHDNWLDQREPSDTRLLFRTAIAAGDEERVAELRQWLALNNQQDARYPETDL